VLARHSRVDGEMSNQALGIWLEVWASRPYAGIGPDVFNSWAHSSSLTSGCRH